MQNNRWKEWKNPKFKIGNEVFAVQVFRSRAFRSSNYNNHIVGVTLGKIVGFYSNGYKVKIFRTFYKNGKTSCTSISLLHPIHSYFWEWIEKTPSESEKEIMTYLPTEKDKYLKILKEQIQTINRELKERIIFT